MKEENKEQKGKFILTVDESALRMGSKYYEIMSFEFETHEEALKKFNAMDERYIWMRRTQRLDHSHLNINIIVYDNNKECCACKGYNAYDYVRETIDKAVNSYMGGYDIYDEKRFDHEEF